jgi:uncharacterized protein YjlB
MTAESEVRHFLFADTAAIPNNPRLPLVIYVAAFAAGEPDSLARTMEDRFEQHGWPPAWRWGVYDFPHYHSTAHELLGVFRGTARLRLGHDAGREFQVSAGDVIVIPAGVGHHNLGSSADFQVVGAYPTGQKANLLRGEPGERPAADRAIAQVPLPKSDPLTRDGPLTSWWRLS